MGRRPLVLGVDGGGTKTIGLISDEQGNILARREVGGTNPNIVGFDSAAKITMQLISKCCEDVRIRTDELGFAVLGLAGAGRDADRKRIHGLISALAEKEGSKGIQMIVETDARVALEGAFAGGPGVVVIAGTGSIVVGKTQRGDIIRVGGWGRVLGDEGGGYFIGREALRSVALHYDRRGDSGKLREVLARRFHWESPDQIMAAVYQEKFDLASLAPLVFETAADNDQVSQRILQNAASLLAEQARIVVMQMGILRKVGLAMCGGLIDHETVYANVLHMKILRLLPQVDIRPATHTPAHGAVLMALERLKRP